MAFFFRSVGRRTLAAVAVAEEFSLAGGCCSLRSYGSLSPAFERTGLADSAPRLKERSVAVFWDLDNKPPKNVPPFKAATRLRAMAAGFGEVVDVVAYANRHAFSHIPTWVHEERKERKMLDELEQNGLVKPEQPYLCGVCGAKKKTRLELTKHFKMLHEREHKKRMNHLESLKGKKRQKERFWDKNVEKEAKYKEAARSIIIPKIGYGLMGDLRRAGVFVRTVEDKPQAADIALQEHMTKSIKRGVKCICLVSDDSDFTPMLRMARERSLHTIVVGDLRVLSAYADTYFSWAEVASGVAEQRAKRETSQLMAHFLTRLESKLDDPGKFKGFGFDAEDLDEGESETDAGSESDEEESWRFEDSPEEWEEASKSLDFLSDDSSGSESEGEAELDAPKSRKLHSVSYVTKFGPNVPIRSRGFSSDARIATEIPSPSDGTGETEVRTSANITSERVTAHGEFLTDGSIPVEVKTAVAGGVYTPSTSPISSGGSDFEGTETNPESSRTSDATIEAGLRFFLTNQDIQARSTSPSRKSKGVSNGDEKAGRGRQKRTKLKRLSTHFGGGSNEPIPFFMSGFASESQADCDAVNDYYQEWWRDDEKEYKGRRVNKHEK